MISLLRGVRQDFCKSVFARSLGAPGTTINVGKRSVRETVGVAGSDVSHVENLIDGRGREPDLGQRVERKSRSELLDAHRHDDKEITGLVWPWIFVGPMFLCLDSAATYLVQAAGLVPINIG